MGDLLAGAGDHVVSFSVQSSVYSDGGFDSSNGMLNFFPQSFQGPFGPSIVAQKDGLSYDFDNDDYFVEATETSGNDELDMYAGQLSAGPITYGSGLYISDSASGSGGVYIAETGSTIIATPLTSAAPEPSAWALMIVGLAACGLSLRRAVTRRGLSFARALRV